MLCYMAIELVGNCLILHALLQLKCHWKQVFLTVFLVVLLSSKEYVDFVLKNDEISDREICIHPNNSLKKGSFTLRLVNVST